MNKEIISGFSCDNLTDEEFTQLRKLKRRKRTISNPSKYKIVITSEKGNYKNLSEFTDHPEKGARIGTFYFSSPYQLDLILKAFEGLFFQLFLVDKIERIGYGMLDDSIYEYWLDDECCTVCNCCFLRKDNGTDKWGCRKEK